MAASRAANGRARRRQHLSQREGRRSGCELSLAVSSFGSSATAREIFCGRLTKAASPTERRCGSSPTVRPPISARAGRLSRERNLRQSARRVVIISARASCSGASQVQHLRNRYLSPCSGDSPGRVKRLAPGAGRSFDPARRRVGRRARGRRAAFSCQCSRTSCMWGALTRFRSVNLPICRRNRVCVPHTPGENASTGC